MIYLTLFYEFFKTGLFAVGGGLATLPFLQQMADKYPWLTSQMLADMIAVSESTPGPLGINMATYSGYVAAGIPGALVATLSLVLPSLIIIMVIARMLQRYKENALVQSAFSGLRPAVAGLIAAAGWSVLEATLIKVEGGAIAPQDYRYYILFVLLLVVSNIKKLKKLHPAVYIAAGAAAGVIFGF